MAVGLEYLRHVGIDWSPHPTDEDVRREYERIWSQLGGRAIEELMDLPLMTDPASLATIDVLIKLGQSTRFTDPNLFALTMCTAVISASSTATAMGRATPMTAGHGRRRHFGDYQAGYRFGQLGYELVEKRGLKRFQARTYRSSAMPSCHGRDTSGRAVIWCVARSRWRIRLATRFNDVQLVHLITNLLAAGDPLVEAQRETEHGLALAQQDWVRSRQ